MTITCPQCSATFPLSDAIGAQYEQEIVAREHRSHEKELAAVRDQAAAKVREELQVTMKATADEAAEEKATNKQLRGQLTDLLAEMRILKKERADEKIAAERALLESQDAIRKEAQERAEEEASLKLAEKDEQIRQAKAATAALQRRLDQGSQQVQGEALELDLEQQLRQLFPLDEISEVKKGSRGADMNQRVRTAAGSEAGVILWECKNAKWNPGWVTKLKSDMREAHADHAVLVVAHRPEGMSPIHHVEGTVWVVEPRMLAVIGRMLRQSVLHVAAMQTLSRSADERMAAMQAYVCGPEFRGRVEAIVEGFQKVQAEIASDRTESERRWCRMEKQLSGVILNTVGLQGDFEGLAGLSATVQAAPRLLAG